MSTFDSPTSSSLIAAEKESSVLVPLPELVPFINQVSNIAEVLTVTSEVGTAAVYPQLTAAIRDGACLINDYRDKHVKALDALKKQTVSWDTSVEWREAELRSLNQRKYQAELEIETRAKELASKDADLLSLRTDIEDSKKSLQNVKSQLESEKAELTSTERQRSRQEAEIKNLHLVEAKLKATRTTEELRLQKWATEIESRSKSDYTREEQVKSREMNVKIREKDVLMKEVNLVDRDSQSITIRNQLDKDGSSLRQAGQVLRRLVGLIDDGEAVYCPSEFGSYIQSLTEMIKSNIKSLKEQLETVQTTSAGELMQAQVTITGLEEQLKLVAGRRDRYEKRAANWKEKWLAREKTLVAMDARANDVIDNMQRSITKHDALQEANDRLTIEVADLDRMKTEAVEYKDLVTQLKEKLTAQQQANGDLAQEFQQERSAWEREVANHKEINGFTFEMWLTTNRNLQSTVDQLRRNTEKLSHQNKTLKTEYASSQARVSELEAEERMLQDRTVELWSRIKDQTVAANDTEASLDDRIERLECCVATQRNELTALRSTKRTLETQVADLQKSLDVRHTDQVLGEAADAQMNTVVRPHSSRAVFSKLRAKRKRGSDVLEDEGD